MKRYIILLMAAVSMYGVAISQNNSQSILGVKVNVQSFEYQANSVKIDLEYNLEELKIGVNESVVFTPKIDNGESSLTLSTLVVKRRGGAKSYERAVTLDNTKSIEVYEEWYGKPHKVVELYGKNRATTVQYSLSVPYQTWMAGSKLSVDCATCGCCTSTNNGVLTPQDNTLLIDTPTVEPYCITPQVELIKPEKVAVKRRDIQYYSSLIFRVNSTYIDPNLENNRDELALIDEMMQSVISDSDYTITKVNIIGYASPEGTLSTNMRLSEGRAGALERLMKREYKMIKPELYSVRFGGENWSKLREIVSQSDASWRDDVLNIIDNVAIEDGRESKLMSLNGGTTYRYLLREVFPSTRLVMVDVEYNIDAYDLTRIGELLDSKPQNLSLEEMYRLSETYSVEDKEFEKIFLTAAKIYPDDEVALNNALVTEIRRGNLSSIRELVERIDRQTTTAELANSLGVYYMMVADYDSAKSLLQRAEQLGSSRAKHNMSQLLIKLENLRQIKESEAFRAEIYGD